MRFEAPDTCFIDYTPELASATLLAIFEQLKRFAADKRFVFTVNDVSRLRHVTPDVRKVAVEQARLTPIRGLVILGASVHVWAMGLLISKSIQVFTKSTDRMPFHFVHTEAEARAWLAVRRAAVTVEMGETSEHGA